MLIKEIEKALAEARYTRRQKLEHDPNAFLSGLDMHEQQLLDQYERVSRQNPLNAGDILLLSDMMKIYEARLEEIQKKLSNVVVREQATSKPTTSPLTYVTFALCCANFVMLALRFLM